MPASTIPIVRAPAASPTSTPPPHTTGIERAPPEPIQAQVYPAFRILLICSVVMSIALIATIIIVLS
jgi:hypothetical protein